jgi:hypothetical protein
MSAPGPDCVVCGRAALDLSGWDGGFPAYREFRAVWDPPRVFQDMAHFTCLRSWEHRDAMLAELVTLATDAVLDFDVEVDGTTHHLTREGLGFIRRRLETDELLVLQHRGGAEWLIVELAGSWQFVQGSDLVALVRGETRYVQGGRGRYGLTLSPAPAEAAVRSWVLADLIDCLGIADRYPGLAESDANLRIDAYNPSSGWCEYIVDHQLTIHPAALAFFRAAYERDGAAALRTGD